ncbi:MULTISPECIES: dipicolinate synthase subunit B [Terribacillus]|jgi:dipicolinate synthase subunit B|uniref:Dipicolinate synthase subunit B n=1 Tax=Terribacillus saccharophilus TaxID=361277 RepID=A0A1H8ALE3_9BACI|nr:MULTISPECIES: dipicolinate synthase subunit B [Terribacillus]AIF66424.1 dipicolinate synthase subunit B [Terribacillus goriensis]MCM3224874.1 dipicolinate synthase subunit B [Terribacillus saccharophilus]MEC0283206.1 dipicolinate synthase subunit B [Terribacillus saccharophilus]MEC0290162.1 dipicolinate synthase subunit B [Terribacillus saccharophilus]PAD37053.1 dipicolinate synthase subunit B [Terribacillus saccharophilus]
MSLAGKRIGFGITGSHCTYSEIFPQIEQLVKLGAEVVPIVSNTVQFTDTYFGDAKDHLQKISDLTKTKIIKTIPEAEPLGPREPLDCMVIAPLTGNSMSKLANALTDSAVLMATKATLRNEKPIVLGISTNDALGLNGVNLMRLMAAKYMYFIPFGQDDPYKKPNSLVADMTKLPETIEAALQYKQLQPVLVQRFS